MTPVFQRLHVFDAIASQLIFQRNCGILQIRIGLPPGQAPVTVQESDRRRACSTSIVTHPHPGSNPKPPLHFIGPSPLILYRSAGRSAQLGRRLATKPRPNSLIDWCTEIHCISIQQLWTHDGAGNDDTLPSSDLRRKAIWHFSLQLHAGSTVLDSGSHSAWSFEIRRRDVRKQLRQIQDIQVFYVFFFPLTFSLSPLSSLFSSPFTFFPSRLYTNYASHRNIACRHVLF